MQISNKKFSPIISTVYKLDDILTQCKKQLLKITPDIFCRGLYASILSASSWFQNQTIKHLSHMNRTENLKIWATFQQAKFYLIYRRWEWPTCNRGKLPSFCHHGEAYLMAPVHEALSDEPTFQDSGIFAGRRLNKSK